MKKLNKFIIILLIALYMLNFLIINKVNANAAIFYPSEVEIQINNLPKDEKFEIEIMVVTEAIDILGEDPRMYSKDAYAEIAKKSDGIFNGLKMVTSGYNSQSKEWIYNQEETKYYYKSLNKKTISNTEDVKLILFPQDSILYKFQDGMVIRINDKYSLPSSLGNLGQPEITKNYYSLDYETMQLERIYENDGMASTIKRFYDGPIFFNIILCVIFTLIIELIISKIFKIANTKIILKINLLTQIVLHIVTVIVLSIFSLTYKEYIFLLITFELIVILSEILLYKRKIKDISMKKISTFAIIANTCSFLVSPTICILINNLM